MNHTELKQAVIDAIRNLHSDTSVNVSQTLDSMTDVAEEIDGIVEALEMDVNT